MSKCSIWWCEKPHYALGYCKAHWAGLKRYGHPYGRHKEQLCRIDDAILKARLIALRVTEFDQTEFEHTTIVAGENYYNYETVPSTPPECSFCGEKDGTHKPLCIVKLSESLLKSTKRR